MSQVELPVELRSMRWWDIAAVLDLERELFGATAWSAETFWSELARPHTRRYWVAIDATGVVGYAGLLLGVDGDADVQTLAVAPRCQGIGLGRRLLNQLLKEAREQGTTCVLLEVAADNAGAIALYTTTGFERIAVRRGYYQPGGGDAWIMRLRPV